MLWAIDVGNTQIVVGVHDGQWRQVWRLDTHRYSTEDELGAALKPLCDLAQIQFEASGVVVASVVPSLERAIQAFSVKWLSCEAFFIRTGEQVDLNVDYEPADAVGADRLANALAALAKYAPPIIVVDFGTATTFDTIDASGTYVGGAIMPGPEVSAASLAQRTAKLPSVSLEVPNRAIGKNVVGSLRSGLVLGYADAVDGLVRRIKSELGGEVTVIATGGLGGTFTNVCSELQCYDAHLTLDGLLIAWNRVRA